MWGLVQFYVRGWMMLGLMKLNEIEWSLWGWTVDGWTGSICACYMLYLLGELVLGQLPVRYEIK